MRIARVVTVAAMVAAALVWTGDPARADVGSLQLDSGWASTPHPVLSARVKPKSLFGTYELSWHLEKDGSPVEGRTGTASGTLDPTAGYTTDPFDIPATGLADGTYHVLGSITVHRPDDSSQTDTFDESFLVDFTGPHMTSLKLSTPTIHPYVPESLMGPGHEREVRIVRGAGSDFPSGYNLMRDGTKRASVWATSSVSRWNGRVEPSGAVVPAGTYTLVPIDSHGNPANLVGQVVVTHKRMVQHYWTRTVTPRASLQERYVGRCSTLRAPARAGWRGSLGYYSNTRCRTRSARKTSVSTLHAIRLPAVTVYAGVRVDTFGGGARSKPRSAAVIRFLGTDDRWYGERRLNGKVLLHTGPTAGSVAERHLFRNRVFAWNLVTGYGNRYDVKSFNVVLRYYQLQ